MSLALKAKFALASVCALDTNVTMENRVLFLVDDDWSVESEWELLTTTVQALAVVGFASKQTVYRCWLNWLTATSIGQPLWFGAFTVSLSGFWSPFLVITVWFRKNNDDCVFLYFTSLQHSFGHSLIYYHNYCSTQAIVISANTRKLWLCLPYFQLTVHNAQKGNTVT